MTVTESGTVSESVLAVSETVLKLIWSLITETGCDWQVRL